MDNLLLESAARDERSSIGGAYPEGDMQHPTSPNRAIRDHRLGAGIRWVGTRLRPPRRYSTGWTLRYGAAVVLVAVAYLSRQTLLPDAGDKSPFQTFVIAALASALLGGFGPGVLATALGGAIAIYLYLPPFQAMAIDTGSDALRLLLFLAEGLLSAAAGEAVRRAATKEQAITRSAERFRRFLREASNSRSLPSDDEVLLVETLSERETEIARLLALGLRNDEIAERLFVSRNTVKTHLSHIYGKLGVRTRTEAVARCIDLGLLADPSKAEPGANDAAGAAAASVTAR
jgi:DNA-binding CsgD family transcriptional regulator